jgi:hypothetical protein
VARNQARPGPGVLYYGGNSRNFAQSGATGMPVAHPDSRPWSRPGPAAGGRPKPLGAGRRGAACALDPSKAAAAALLGAVAGRTCPVPSMCRQPECRGMRQ